MGWHGAISGFIRVIGIIQAVGFLESLSLLDDTVCILGAVFSHPGFNTGSIKQSHGSFCSVNALVNRFGQVNKPVEHRLQVQKEVLFEACELRSIRNNIKATEIP